MFCRLLLPGTVLVASFLATAVHGASPATWTNVTPAGIDLNGSSFNNDNFGVQDVLVDPARASDLYAFTCHQGVWKSADYGKTWAKINTGTNGAALDGGKLMDCSDRFEREPRPCNATNIVDCYRQRRGGRLEESGWRRELDFARGKQHDSRERLRQFLFRQRCLCARCRSLRQPAPDCGIPRLSGNFGIHERRRYLVDDRGSEQHRLFRVSFFCERGRGRRHTHDLADPGTVGIQYRGHLAHAG